MACGIFPDQGSNPCPLHLQADSLPLSHQRSPKHLEFDETRGQCSWGHLGAPGNLGPHTEVTLSLPLSSASFFLPLDFGRLLPKESPFDGGATQCEQVLRVLKCSTEELGHDLRSDSWMRLSPPGLTNSSGSLETEQEISNSCANSLVC